MTALLIDSFYAATKLDDEDKSSPVLLGCLIAKNKYYYVETKILKQMADFFIEFKIYSRRREMSFEWNKENSDSVEEIRNITYSACFFDSIVIDGSVELGYCVFRLIASQSSRLKELIIKDNLDVSYKNEEALTKNHCLKKLRLEGCTSPNYFCPLISEGFPSFEMLVFRYAFAGTKEYDWRRKSDHHLAIRMPLTTLKCFKLIITTTGSGDTYSKGIHIKIVSDTAKPQYGSFIPAGIEYDGRCELRPMENPGELDYEDDNYDNECLTLYIRCKSIDAAAIRYTGNTHGNCLELLFAESNKNNSS